MSQLTQNEQYFRAYEKSVELWQKDALKALLEGNAREVRRCETILVTQRQYLEEYREAVRQEKEHESTDRQ